MSENKFEQIKVPEESREGMEAEEDFLDNQENLGVFENIEDDPNFCDLQKEITRRTNLDTEVQDAVSGNYSERWNRVYRRERMRGFDNFVRSYPQKTEAYASRWRDFVKEHQEVNGMNNAQWDNWCDEHKSASAMNEYRKIAHAREYFERIKQEEMLQSSVQNTIEGIQQERYKLKIPSRTEQAESSPNVELSIEKLRELQTQITIEKIKDSVPKHIIEADGNTLEQKREELKELPYVHGNDLREIIDYRTTGESEFNFIETDKIIGSVSPAFEDWSTEYEGRKNRITTIAKELCEANEESTERTFHLKDPKRQVQLLKIPGPKPNTEVYFVDDGTHRVAACKLIELSDIPAQVKNMEKVKKVQTIDRNLAYQWEERIERGLITGKINWPENEGNEIELEIDEQVLPWMHLPQQKFIRFNRFYDSRYPEALDGLRTTKNQEIPKEVFLDDIVWNTYLAGKYKARK